MRLLILGLDGATFDQLLPRTEAGQMPTLKRLLDEGLWGPLASTHPPVTAPAWSTFITGLNPGQHGVFSFVEFLPGPGGEMQTLLNNLSTIQGYRLWNYLNRHGLSVGLSNVPMTHPAEPLEGFMISDLMASGARRATTYPESLKEELRSNTSLSFDRAIMDGLAQSPGYLQHLIESLATQEQADLYLMQRQAPDVFITVYAHTDTLQHYYWRHLDPSHPEHDPREAERLSSLFERFFRRLDSVIANLLDATGPETPLLIISDHGFGPIQRMVFVNRWLQTRGYLTLAEKASDRRSTLLSRIGLTPTTVKKWLKRGDFLGLRHRLSKEMRHKLRDTIGQAFQSTLDRHNTQAYAQAHADQGIYINQRSALNPEGQDFTGQEYECLREELIGELQGLCDPVTGLPVFELVARREEVYRGQYLSKAPDIVLQPARGYFFSAEVGGKDQNIITSRGGLEITGFHRPDGIFIAYGPDCQSGRIQDARMVDLAPTVLHSLGLPVPSHLDGRVWDLAAGRPAQSVVFEEVAPPEARTRTTEHPAEEEAERIKRLQDLGYL